MKMKLFVALFAVLAMAVCVAADERAALDKVSAAADAAAAKDSAKMASALGEAASIIADDAKAAGSVPAAWAGKLKESFTGTVESMRGIRPATPATFEVFKTRIQDLYGAIIPAAKGDSAAAAEYVRKQAAKTTGRAKEKLDAAASALASAGADKTAAFTQLRAALGAAAPMARAVTSDLKSTDGLLVAGHNMEYALSTLDAEAAIARDSGNAQKAETIQSFAGDLRPTRFDLGSAIPETEVSGALVDEVDNVIVRGAPDAMPAPAAEAKPAAPVKPAE